jgi:hypothetical protein
LSESTPTARYGLAVATGGVNTTGATVPALLTGGNASVGSVQSATWVFERSLVSAVNVFPMAVETNSSVNFFSNTSGGTRPVAGWSFGDGAQVLAGNGSHAYTRPGPFAGGLKVTDLYGVQNVTSVPILVHLFTLGLSIPANADANVTTSFSIAPMNGTPSYRATWSLSNGVVLRGLSVGCAFPTAGVIVVHLSVQDGTGTVVNSTAVVRVNSALSGTVTSRPDRPDVGASTVLAATGSGGTPPYTYAWTLPSGRTTNGTGASFTPTAAGVTNVSLLISDAVGATWYRVLPITVDPALSFMASASPTGFFSGRSVSFSATVLGGTPPYSYAWRFGDGSSSTDAAPQHTYGSSGTFLVNVWVNDSGGGTYHQQIDAKVVRTSGGLLWQLGGLPLWSQLAIAVTAATLLAMLVGFSVYRSRGRPKPPSTSPSDLGGR